VRNTTAQILCTAVHKATHPGTMVYTDEANSYNALHRPHETVCHAQHEWARDADGDGIREVHTNTLEGMWASFRTFLRPFRGVRKDCLSGYLAIFEFRVNLKRLTMAFVAALVRSRRTLTQSMHSV
jgi:transposase